MSTLRFLLSGVCHQIPERCLHYGGEPLPLCARCLGTFTGIVLAWLVLTSLRRGRAGLPSRPASLILLALAIGWVVDGTNSFWALMSGAPIIYEPSNSLRLLTGLGLGLGMGAVLFPIYQQVSSLAPDERPVLARWREIIPLLLMGGLWALVVMIRWPQNLVFWTLLAGLAVVVALTIVNKLVLLLAFGRGAALGSSHRHGLFWAAGFVAAGAEMVVMAGLRLLLVG
ncbi:MAG: DUF2085 domain-containing protein [Anaerolineae bacterium]